MSSVTLAKGPRPNSDFPHGLNELPHVRRRSPSLAEYKISVSNSSPLALSPRAVLKIDSASLPPKTCSPRRYHHQEHPAASVAFCATPRATGSAISVADFTRGSSLVMSGRTSASTDRNQETDVLLVNFLVLNLLLLATLFSLSRFEKPSSCSFAWHATAQPYRPVRPQQTLKPVTLEVHLSFTEQRERAVGQRGGALVQVHTLRVFFPRTPPLLASMPLPSSRGCPRSRWRGGPGPTRTSTWFADELPHVRHRSRKPNGVQAACVDSSPLALAAERGLEDILGLGNLVLCGVTIATTSCSDL